MDTTQTGDKESAVFITQKKCTVNLHVCESIIDLLPTFCSHIGILLLLNPCPEEPIKNFINLTTNTNYRHVFYTAQCIYIRTSSFLCNLARKYFFYNPINKCSPGSLKKNIFIFSSCDHTTFLKLLPKHAQNFKI